MKKTLKVISVILSVFLISLLLASCDFFNPDSKLPPAGTEGQGQLPSEGQHDAEYDRINQAQNIELGMPEYMGSECLTDENHWIISRPGYTLSYNHERNIPNWVAWHIDASDVGHIKRPKNAFNNDPLIKKGWEPVMYYDYHYSEYGFDRGHMCPNGDRNNDRQYQLDTFYMTNMVPQAGYNNQHAWADLESFIRSEYVLNGMEVYVVSGPSLQNGGSTTKKTGKYPHPGGTWNHITSSHNNGKKVVIDVPAYTWKVFIAIPEGDRDIDRINADPGIAVTYAVWMDNSDVACKGKIFDDFAVSIDYVEEMVGLDFFPLLEDSVEAQLESRDYVPYVIQNPMIVYDESELEAAV